VTEDPTTLTRLLRGLSGADGAEALRFMDEVQQHLRRIAAREMRSQPLDHTLQVTALINEAVLRIMRAGATGWNDRDHFFATAATAMRHVLVDCARRRKRRSQCVEDLARIERLVEPYERSVGDLEDLDRALRRLAELDPVGARVIELRFFLGLPMSEVSGTMKLPQRTVERRWAAARAWLYQELRHDA
jgi:RNA polymerase sigma factor (TIGR02999 family)